MDQSKPLWLAFTITFVLTLTAASVIAAHYLPSTPRMAVSLASPVAQISDFTGISLGLRKLVSDIAWIQTLIYYGTHEEGMTEEDAHEGRGEYPLFLAYCQRVAQIDPHFKYIFYYGGSVLGWNLKRFDEAESFIKEGIQAHPKEWRYQQFLAAIAFQKSHNMNDLVNFLEVFIEDRDCPNILRSILANIYKKQKDYIKALRVWMFIYDTNDESYRVRAVSEIDEISQLIQNQHKK